MDLEQDREKGRKTHRHTWAANINNWRRVITKQWHYPSGLDYLSTLVGEFGKGGGELRHPGDELIIIQDRWRRKRHVRLDR